MIEEVKKILEQYRSIPEKARNNLAAQICQLFEKKCNHLVSGVTGICIKCGIKVSATKPDEV